MSAVTLELAKEFLQIGHDRQDNVVQMLIDAAEAFVEQHLGVKLTSAEYEEDLPLSGGPLDLQRDYTFFIPGTGDDCLRPSRRPVTAVDSVTDNWADNAEFQYTLVNDLIARADENGRPLGRWPQGIARFHVTYTAGFETVPAQLTQAICQLVKRAYDARGGETGSGAAGASVTYGGLRDSDILQALKPFSRRQRAGF